MAVLLPFDLEDFHDKYEHSRELVNLASSGCEPWTFEEFKVQLGDNWIPSQPLTLGYPDPMAELVPALTRAFGAPTTGFAIPTAGAEESIALVMHSLAAHGVHSIGLPKPGYGAFRGWATMLNLRIEAYHYDPRRDWQPAMSEMDRIAEKCDAMVVINPHNPVGHVLPASDLRRFAGALDQHDGTLVVDKVFGEIGFSESLAYAAENVLVIGGLSKVYGLPGLRLGWILGEQKHLKPLRTVQQYTTLRAVGFYGCLWASRSQNRG